MLDDGSDFKQDFNPFLKHLYIKPDLTTIKNPHAKALVERVHLLVLNMLVTKYHTNKVFDYIYPWVETLVSGACAIKVYYHYTIHSTLGQSIVGRDMILNLTSQALCFAIQAASTMTDICAGYKALIGPPVRL